MLLYSNKVTYTFLYRKKTGANAALVFLRLKYRTRVLTIHNHPPKAKQDDVTVLPALFW
jgi:hypothetical protein